MNKKYDENIAVIPDEPNPIVSDDMDDYLEQSLIESEEGELLSVEETEEFLKKTED